MKMRKLFTRAIPLAMVTLILLPIVAFAQSTTPISPGAAPNMTLVDFLVWLTGGGAIIFTSWILEKIQWYQGLSPDQKQAYFFGFSVIVALAAYAVQTYVPTATLQMLAPWFTIVSATFAAIYLGSTFHSATKLTQPPVDKTSVPPQP